MDTNFSGEKWKEYKIELECTNKFRVEVSNHGRIRTFNKISNGRIIKGSVMHGYPFLHLKLYRPREEKVQKRLDYYKQQVLIVTRKLKKLQTDGESKKVIKETAELLAALKMKLSNKFKEDNKQRMISHSVLIHRMVARCFMKPPKKNETILAHMDYDKLNNKVENLKWMTPEENYPHRKNYPLVIADMQGRQMRVGENFGPAKLSVTKVMLLKKLLIQKKPMKDLVRQFKVTETQIYRIKRGENWSHIEAAK